MAAFDNLSVLWNAFGDCGLNRNKTAGIYSSRGKDVIMVRDVSETVRCDVEKRIQAKDPFFEVRLVDLFGITNHR